MNLHPTPIKPSLNKAYRKEKVPREDIELFKTNLARLLDRIDTDESEENAKHHLRDFLNDTWYADRHLVATKERSDLVIHTGPKAASPVSVLFEVKRPRGAADPRAADMISAERPNAKALHELLHIIGLEETKDKTKRSSAAKQPGAATPGPCWKTPWPPCRPKTASPARPA